MPNKTNKEENARIGELLKAARRKYNVTQAEVVKATGMSKNQISAIECGQSKVSVEVMLGYCKKLGITPNELLGFSDDVSLSPELRKVLRNMDAKEQNKLAKVIKLLKSS